MRAGNAQGSKLTLKDMETYVKQMVGKAKEVNLEEIDNLVINGKACLYNTYYLYFIHHLTKNNKKAIENAAEWLKYTSKTTTYTATYLLNCLYQVSVMCVRERAYRQNAYLLEAAKIIVNQKADKIDNLEFEKLNLMLQEIFTIFHLLKDIRKLEEEGNNNSTKFFDFFIPFEIDGVTVEATNPVMEGSVKKRAKLYEIGVKAKNMEKEALKIASSIQGQLSPNNILDVKGKFDELKLVSFLATIQYGV